MTPDTREQINTVLDALRHDREKSRRMQPDGSYIREKGGDGTSSQEALYRYFSAYKVGVEPEPVVVRVAPEHNMPVPVERVPARAPTVALEKSPPPEEHTGFLRRLRSFFS